MAHRLCAVAGGRRGGQTLVQLSCSTMYSRGIRSIFIASSPYPLMNMCVVVLARVCRALFSSRDFVSSFFVPPLCGGFLNILTVIKFVSSESIFNHSAVNTSTCFLSFYFSIFHFSTSFWVLFFFLFRVSMCQTNWMLHLFFTSSLTLTLSFSLCACVSSSSSSSRVYLWCTLVTCLSTYYFNFSSYYFPHVSHRLQIG